MTTPAKASYQRIATEEAFAPPELMKRYRELLAAGIDDPGFQSLWGFYLSSPSARATAIIERLQDMGERRIRDMDESGIDKQLLLLTSPGVQIMKADEAVGFAAFANDWLADHIRKHPTRYAGLAAAAPQNPAAAAKEIERSVNKLGLKGVVINSHTHDEYLDDQKFWPIFEAAAALDVPVYIHPNTPPRGLIGPLRDAGLDGAIYGFAVESGMHLLRIITSGVFDRFPKLKIVFGHLGEGIPFWLFRVDYMHRATVASKRYDVLKPLKKKPSDYMRENVYVTTSGMAWEPAITFCQKVLGMDRVLYAMDYPYQFDVNEVIASDNLPLSAADKAAFFQGNAERIFKL